jgi:lactoylglutathione lyase
MAYASHRLVVVADLLESLDFYVRFGNIAVLHRRSRNGPTQEIAWLGDPDQPFRLMLVQGPPAEPPIGPYGHIGISCRELDEYQGLLEAARSHLTLHGGPASQPWLICDWFSILDPDGNRVEISFGQDAAPPEVNGGSQP